MTLSNGFESGSAERHELPLVNFTMLVDCGTSADSPAMAGNREYDVLSADQRHGTSTTALQISDEIQRPGSRARGSSGLDSSTVYLSSLKSKLEPSLALFSDVLLHPSFPQEDFRAPAEAADCRDSTGEDFPRRDGGPA